MKHAKTVCFKINMNRDFKITVNLRWKLNSVLYTTMELTPKTNLIT